MQSRFTNYHLLAKPAGAAYNLGCQYCFLLSKENLYDQRESPLMTDEILETYMTQLLASSPGPQVDVASQGGEPMLRGLDFYKRSVALVNLHRQPHHRTSAHDAAPDDKWATFFKQHKYLVGLSIDGPRALHDAYQIDKSGKGSFDDVIRGWNYLRGHDLDVTCTVIAANASHPLEVYRFFETSYRHGIYNSSRSSSAQPSRRLRWQTRGWGGAQGTDRPLYKQAGHLVPQRSVIAEQFGNS